MVHPPKWSIIKEMKKSISCYGMFSGTYNQAKKNKAQTVHRLCLIYEKEGLNYQCICYFSKNNTQTNFLNNYLC